MLTIEQLVDEHDKLIKLFGGTFGINYEGKLKSAVEKYNENRNKKSACIELYYDVLVGHPFVDGNKRTATHFPEHLLELNNYKLNANNKELVNMALDIARRNEVLEKKRKKAIPLVEVKSYVGKYIQKA